MAYIHEVGERLRRVRESQRRSLQDVELASGGVFGAAALRSSERGDRNISASRLCELADFYGVSWHEVLPGDATAVIPRHGDGVVFDLARVTALGGRWTGLRRFCESIQIERGDFNRQVLSIRDEDLCALAVMLGTSPKTLVDELRDLGAIHQGS